MNYEQIRAMIIQHEDMCLTHEHNEAGYKDKKQSREELVAYVLSLQERNEELLEALKGMKDAFCNPESGEIDKRLAVQDMNIAITKAEAAE